MHPLGRVAVLALGLALAVTGAEAPFPAAAQTSCEFVLRFAVLRDHVGADVVGPCLEDQRTTFGGNAVQRTANGLMVWRLADNWIAFTDGYRTWLDGPNGLEVRLNIDIFAWEAAPA